MTNPRAAVQLIVFGSRNRSDFPGVLQDIAAAGFPAIEAGNLFDQLTEPVARDLLAENGLGVSGAHFGYGEFADDARIEHHLAYMNALGIRYLMCSGVADSGSLAGYKASAARFNDIGRMARAAGAQFCYHNHAWEFTPQDGGCGMDVLLAETDPDLVGLNLDVYWLYYANRDPAAFIAANHARAHYYHFKDGNRQRDAEGKVHPRFLELGRGEVDLDSAMAAAREAGAEWIVAEQDSTDLPHRESVTISRRYMRDRLGV
ncbi:MAG: sugar phosphate isomerase/epimerase [Armatimonadetes bacterium]|nr:sugar phosphate isomerase/epimerase [Armatimonadota bacterium]MDE2205014.1 sugar phosphate isomerase/epimerase [Armatimonadota bacterium]